MKSFVILKWLGRNSEEGVRFCCGALLVELV